MLKQLVTAFFISVTLCFVAKAAHNSLTDYDIGLDYYEKRSESAVGIYAKETNINKAISHLLKAIKDPEYELEAGILLLRCYDFKGSFTQIEDREKVEIFEKGMSIGEELIQKYPNNAGLIYWYMSNVGRWGQTVNFWKAVRANIAGTMRELCEKVIALNPSYNDAGAYRILGILNIKIPHIPVFITWPSDEEGLEMLKKATELGPESIGNWVFYAEALSKMGQKEKAISILETSMSKPPRPHRLVEDRKILEKARELLKEIEG